MDDSLRDKNGKAMELRDFVASEIVDVQIGQLGHRLWVCIDGCAVLRVVAPEIECHDARINQKGIELDRVVDVLVLLFKQGEHGMEGANSEDFYMAEGIAWGARKAARDLGLMEEFQNKINQKEPVDGEPDL